MQHDATQCAISEYADAEIQAVECHVQHRRSRSAFGFPVWLWNQFSGAAEAIMFAMLAYGATSAFYAACAYAFEILPEPNKRAMFAASWVIAGLLGAALAKTTHELRSALATNTYDASLVTDETNSRVISHLFAATAGLCISIDMLLRHYGNVSPMRLLVLWVGGLAVICECVGAADDAWKDCQQIEKSVRTFLTTFALSLLHDGIIVTLAVAASPWIIASYLN